MTSLFAKTALLPEGWAQDVLITIDPRGFIMAVQPGQTPPADAEILKGPVLAGMANIHSHAFQRAMAGHTEKPSGGQDSFWSWRDLMYRFAGNLTAEDMHIIAAQLYIEMLKAGYTAVGEFHYIHHQPDGQAYADPAEASHAVITAALEAGICITHLPVLYQRSGFGSKTVDAKQKRFLHSTDGFLKLRDQLVSDYKAEDAVRIGTAFHSLRAVSMPAISEVMKADASSPIHIHIAEQKAEVEDCLTHHRQRPIDYLYDHVAIDENWCLIHATHIDKSEITRISKSGAITGLCPTTEANLGDGLFPLADFIKQSGLFAIGSDSHVSVNMIEELRLLEYGQRLISQSRSIARAKDSDSVGETLFTIAAQAGAQALGSKGGKIETGARADFIMLDPDHPALCAQPEEGILDGMIFATNSNPIRHVMANGKWVIRDGCHDKEAEIYQRFRQRLIQLYKS